MKIQTKFTVRAWVKSTGILIVCLLGYVTSAMCLSGQNVSNTYKAQPDRNSSEPVSFDVASIKPSQPTGPVGAFVYPGGKIRLLHYSVKMMILQAFDLQDYQLAGGPDWISRLYFDVTAQPPDGSEAQKSHPSSPKEKPSKAQNAMLQALLVERFGLKLKRSVKEERVLNLNEMEGRFKGLLTQNADQAPWCGGIEHKGAMSGTGIAADNITMNEFASCLSRYMGKKVVNATARDGHYDFKSEVLDDSEPDIISSIPTALRTLGLKLVPGKAPVDVWTVEDVMHPTPD